MAILDPARESSFDPGALPNSYPLIARKKWLQTRQLPADGMSTSTQTEE